MIVKNIADPHTDYHIGSTSYVTVTGITELLSMSHDKIWIQLSEGTYASIELWKRVKPYIHELSVSDEYMMPGLSYEQNTTNCKKRWSAEAYHKSIKSNLGFAKSLTKTDHFVLSIIGYVKPEWLQRRTNQNHFSMKAKLCQAAIKAARIELLRLSKSKAA